MPRTCYLLILSTLAQFGVTMTMCVPGPAAVATLLLLATATTTSAMPTEQVDRRTSNGAASAATNSSVAPVPYSRMAHLSFQDMLMLGADAKAYGAAEGGSGGKISRATVIKRAMSWVDRKQAYSQCNTDHCGPCKYCSSYRCDCSGLVAYSWDAQPGLNTYSLRDVAKQIKKDDLKPGDVLLNYRDHVIMFAGWADNHKTKYHAIQEAGCHAAPLPPYASKTESPYPSTWDQDLFLPYRYHHIHD